MSARAPEGRSVFERIYMVVRQVPAGRVTTYGQVSKIVGGCDARTVGYAMGAVKPEMHVPWHRVVNSQGKISLAGSDQRQKLEAEGVAFDAKERIDLKRFGWDGPDDDWLEAHGFDVTWFWNR